MKRSRASGRKLTGIYTRGKTFWFTYRLNGKKHFHSLGTKDYGEAVAKALAIRQTPELEPGAAFGGWYNPSITTWRAPNSSTRG